MTQIISQMNIINLANGTYMSWREVRMIKQSVMVVDNA